jgi:Uma2 family endonuclease
MPSVEKFIPSYSVADYLNWEGDWELWSGVPIAMTPSPFGAHQALSLKLASEFLVQLQQNSSDDQFPRYTVLQEIDWIVDEHTVVRPDIVVTAGGIPDRHLESCPLLIVEILSPATEERDRTIKFRLYQQQGVGHYLIADPKSKTIEAYQNVAGNYQRIADADRIKLEIAPGQKITIVSNLAT